MTINHAKAAIASNGKILWLKSLQQEKLISLLYQRYRFLHLLLKSYQHHFLHHQRMQLTYPCIFKQLMWYQLFMSENINKHKLLELCKLLQKSTFLASNFSYNDQLFIHLSSNMNQWLIIQILKAYFQFQPHYSILS